MEQQVNRSGLDRREQEAEIPADHRQIPDRRANVRDGDQIIEFMKRIPTFNGFSDEQYRKILAICSRRDLPRESYLCREGEAADELFVLLKGKLKIMVHGSTLVTFMDPMGLIGEIGVFAGGKRSASVLAFTDSTVIRMHKEELRRLMESDPALSTQLLLNVISDLAGKLQEDNRIVEELRNRKSTMIL
ncbi:MAG: cyclic nucleotide-binding domain-containing protein [Candidatus Latescibacterota bacterium]